MLPTHQGLDTHDPAVEQIHLRLVVQHELLVLEGPADLVLQRQAFGDPLTEARRVEDVFGRGILRLLQRGLRVAHQRIGVSTVCRKQRDAGLG